MEVALNKIVPGSWTRDGTFHHTMEGEDDMPGHVKASLMGPSLNIPVSSDDATVPNHENEKNINFETVVAHNIIGCIPRFQKIYHSDS